MYLLKAKRIFITLQKYKNSKIIWIFGQTTTITKKEKKSIQGKKNPNKWWDKIFKMQKNEITKRNKKNIKDIYVSMLIMKAYQIVFTNNKVPNLYYSNQIILIYSIHFNKITPLSNYLGYRIIKCMILCTSTTKVKCSLNICLIFVWRFSSNTKLS